jgi:hypothetical protein
MTYKFATNIRNFLMPAIQGPSLMPITPGCVRRRNSRHLALLTLAAGALLLTMARPALADNSPAFVIPPNTAPFGLSFGEWSARWWQWIDMLPAAPGYPSNWSGPSDCSTGQLGPVWFLFGTPAPSGPTTISCRVPLGKLLFFPIINVECSNVEGSPFYGDTAQARLQCAQKDFVGADPLSVTVDNQNIQNLKSYLVTSPDFAFAVPPPPNFPGISTGASGLSGSVGYYLMLLLGPGAHTIHFTAQISNATIGGPYKFDTIYKLTIN